MLDNLFILSPTGEVLIEKHWNGKVKRTVCEVFWEEVGKSTSRFEVLPIINTPKQYLVHVQRFGLFFLCAIGKETAPQLCFEVLHRMVDVFVQYFGPKLNEAAMRENFTTVYQLLDEMVDGGYPSTTELNQLKDMISPPSLAQRVFQNVTGEAAVKDDLPSGAVSKIPWRKADVKYVTNEIYFDIVEQMDAIIAANQSVVSIQVYGDIKSNCRLSGMPDLTLTFNKAALIEDCALHRCVRINRYQREHVVSFVPPDGQFTLMSYRVRGITQLPITVKPVITYKAGTGKISITVTGKYMPDKPITDVAINIPLPKALKTSSLSANVGTVKQDQITKVCRWEIGRLVENKIPVLEGTIVLPNDFVPDESPTITAEFACKMFCCSGLKVDGLQIKGVKYKPFKGVRSVTQAGKLQIRC
jgi:AP-3 complex subunit mu